MLETNEVMLTKGRSRRPKDAGDSTIIDPVYIEDDVKLKGSKIGPNVSIGAGSVIEGAEISHSIVGVKAQIRKSVLKNSLVGDEAVVEGVKGEVTVSDHSEVRSS